jgi:thiamine-phosphate diphosphorylase
MSSPLPVIHAVTTDEVVARTDFVDRAAAVMHALGPRGAVHLRAPFATGRQLFDLATLLIPVQQATGAWLVINDRVDVALTTGARGLQLTSRSLTLSDARQALKRVTPGTSLPAIGASVHSAEEARAVMSESGADDACGAAWLVAGHIFTTPSHPGEPGRGSELLREICAAVSAPVIAIGGIRAVDVPLLLAAGAYGVAAIRGVWRAADADRAAAEYLSAHDTVRDTPGVNQGGSDTRARDRTGPSSDG